MCVAVVTKAGTYLSDEALEEGWRCNPDGGGFAYVKDGKVEVQKGFMDFPKFRAAYREAAALHAAASPFLIHMRIRTSGDTDERNTHPFRVKHGALIHNGIMFSPVGEHAQTDGKRNSDTAVFATTLSAALQKDDVIAAKKEIENAISTHNKVALLFHDGEVVILNEDSGKWIGDVWYSNNSCAVSKNFKTEYPEEK